ncbi:MAG: Flp pilus assembly protein CpaB [Elusimicrobiota bacterium]|jgi:pilus assembly protein CpaB|nr:Flp pilus assembly protein CpaB [Elusimicrobiota bacterium]
MKKTLLIAILFAVLTALFSYLYLANLKNQYKSKDEPIQVVIANQPIAQGALIKKEMLSEIAIPKRYRQPRAFNSLDKMFSKEGKSVYMALAAIDEGEQILPAKVSDTNNETGIAHIIPDAHKALVINFDNENTSVLKPGNRIDILSVLDYSDNNNKSQESSFVIAQDILVLAVDDNYLGGSNQKKKDNDNAKGAITAAVTIEEAQIILLAGEKGALKFIIRPIGDNEKINSKTIRMSDLAADISKSISRDSANQAAQNKQEIMNIINKYSAKN